MGSFWDEYDDTPGPEASTKEYTNLPFVTGDEKQKLIADKTNFYITAVRGPASTKFGSSYFADALIEGEKKTFGFKAESVPSRDRLLEALKGHFEDTAAEAPACYLEQVQSENGNTPILIRAASA